VAIHTIHEAPFVLCDDDTRLAFITSFDGLEALSHPALQPLLDEASV
jgi:hypothetical protein